MKNATQSDIDQFYRDTENNPDIYPFRGVGKYYPRWEEKKDNNEGVILTDDRLSYLLYIKFNWHNPLEFDVALFSKSTIAGGRGLKALFEQIKRYKPTAINTTVQESNIKSLRINRKLFGNEWGIEPLSAWNCIDGKYENLHYFRKIL